MDSIFARIGTVRPLLLVVLGSLAGCGDDAVPDDELQPARAPEIVRIVPTEEALVGAHIPTVDPATMNDAEIRKALAAEVRCGFRYTTTGRPVFSVQVLPDGAVSEGVVKLNGNLVMLQPAAATGLPEGGFLMTAGDIRLTIVPHGGPVTGSGAREADMIFEIGDSLRAGYRGYHTCTG